MNDENGRFTLIIRTNDTENSYFTFHRNGIWHCGRFYATTNENGLIFNRGCRVIYAEFHTYYWTGGKLIGGAGPIAHHYGWDDNYATVHATDGNLHCDSMT